MDFEKYILFRAEDFILDVHFIEWVQNPDEERDAFWAEFLIRYPEKNEAVRDAAFIVKGIRAEEEEIPAERLGHMLSRIESGLAERRRRLIRVAMKYAAVFTGVIGLSVAGYLYKMKLQPLPLASLSSQEIARGLVILSDGSSIDFNTEETLISQTVTGDLLINGDTVKPIAKAGKTGRPELVQVITPYGKRTQVALPDGSHIWLNSGSQISYPPEFSGKTREVYLSGEAFFDVAKNAEKPFYVITKDIKIKVLGTRFNVSAYEDEQSVQAVLLEGQVSIGENAFLAKTAEMMPGERSVYHKPDGSFSKGKADVNYFTSWLYGYLIFENEPTPDVFKKLERYYNRPIVVEEGLSNITFSGKLDLKEDIEEVLQTITYSSQVKISREGDLYKVNR
jgi:ferric-dicitrate binding protein FerR (iron transport regulator)